MPANLTPQYLEADRKFREAKTPQDKMKALEEMMATIPKHKGTEKMRAMIKTKMAKLRLAAQARPAATRHGPNFHGEKSGGEEVETELAELIKTADGVLLVLDLADQETPSVLEALFSRLKEKRLELASENLAHPPEDGPLVRETP